LCWSLIYTREQKRTPVQLTILCYHHIDFPKRTPYSVSSKQFLEQLNILEKFGYKIISLEQVEAFYAGKADIPSRSAVITFDDGNIGAYKVAYPLLKKRNIPWTLFIYPAVINSGHDKYAVTWPQVKEMADNGVTIGNHSYSHHFLTSPPLAINNLDLYKKWLNREIVLSKKEIEKKTGRPIKYFAVPFGAFDRYVYNTLKKAGYRLVLNVHGQNNDEKSDPYNLNRQIILSSESLAVFKTKISILPIKFLKTNPPDLARTNIPTSDVEFILAKKDNYKQETIKLKLSGIKSFYLSNKSFTNIYDEKVILHRQGYYLATVLAKDKKDRLCLGTWLFRYDRTTPNFLLNLPKRKSK
jgi:peptidoglycan/xylan/chitin deacetylase (PgdA/CDA1 family)